MLRASADFEYQLTRDEDGVIELKNTKMKEAARARPIYFDTNTIALPWADEDGDPIDSLALSLASNYEPPRRSSNGLGTKQREMLGILGDI